jgi:hypothetical protein
VLSADDQPIVPKIPPKSPMRRKNRSRSRVM